ncbi:malate dehydrogenase [Haemophilus parahaemolyticus]|uniref:Malate dehydrogenase n=2 Tax=Haemophilus parahaemolyticus TaxID=735 RepID=A0AAE6JS58_HAEPH|nr:malate dehydrogenase [Haemophilus parahaemolyticus]EIJ69198.1 malate dehydrogenase, NAD-dependent [Haemophilus parahaemolyticus HK385]OOR95731.1 malate dehydrogenase [Haemophilus parahaemolyticus]QEN11226.1 malate dehydrogenase [Haemophilus parahaemolyticus]QRP12420.1 malate dehydrogenase [Haemophilus parahaemolyticus]STO66793.1 malate dehydrogenase [Haemophilus parahaemolyticus HK385]
MKLTLLGAAGGIGQTLALLLKLRLPIGTELALYDISPVTPGVAVDISHIATSVKAIGYAGEENLAAALKDAHMVLVTAGVARKPGMTRADLFNINGNIIKNLVEKVAEVCPDACVGIVSNPVNTLVPLAAEVLRKKGVYDKRKLFGVSTLDVVRAKSFVSELKEKHAETVKVPVIGGHSGPTILPLLSQALSEGRKIDFTQEEIESLTHRIQNAGTEVVEAKAGGGSATLSMAEAGARFAVAVFKALLGEDCVRYAYVESKKDSGYPEFFAHPVRFGLTGVEEILPIGQLSEYEQEKLKALEEVLEADIKLGKDFVNA